jgi:LysR family transcriptional regulator, transcriptional activator of the cysJI operon
MLENFRLKVFRAVAVHRNFRRAAEELYLSQPAVTQQIKALEQIIGLPLLNRAGREVSLTPAGTILLRHLESSNRILTKALDEIAALKGEVAGPLKVVASTTIAQYVLPQLLGQFARLHPAVRVEVESANTEAVVEAIVAERGGVGMVEGPAHSRDLVIEPWLQDELVLVVPQSHEWAGHSIAAKQLQNMPMLMRERGSGTREILEQSFERAGINVKQLRYAMELNSTEAILACIESGLGLGFASRFAIKRQLELHTLAVVPIPDLLVTRTFTLLTRHGPELQGSAAAFLSHLREYRQIEESKADRTAPTRRPRDKPRK